MRRVAAGEATNFDGVLHKGLPLRVLNNKNNGLILKDDGYDESAPMDNWREGAEMLEDGEGEGTLSEEQLDTIWDELSEAKQMLLEDPRYEHIAEKLGDLMEEFTAAMSQEQQGGGF